MYIYVICICGTKVSYSFYRKSRFVVVIQYHNICKTETLFSHADDELTEK